MDRHLDLGRAPGRANVGYKTMTLVASALAGGDCIDEADGLHGEGPPPWAASGGAMSASWTG